jgi:Signal transduction histidine kinase
MRRESIYSRLKIDNILIMVIISFGIIISMAAAFHTLGSRDSYPAVNNARIITKDALDYINNNFYVRDFSGLNKFDFKTQVLDLNGNLLYNNYDDRSGNIGIINSVGYDMNFSSQNSSLIKFSSPIVVNGTQTGTSIFYIKKGSVAKTNPGRDIFVIFLPSLLALIIVAIKLIYNVRTTKREFINPILEMNRSADAIIKGDFDKKIKYNSNTEIGKLCASFEMMRDELKDSIERERRLEDSRKELITCISHDLKTPISSIKAYVDGIMDGIAKDQDTLFRYLSVIGRKTQTLTKLINDLFDHCQIELNKLSIEKKEVYSGDFLRHISDELSLEFKNSPYLFEVTDMPDVLINIDRLRIEQVIYNLIQNAKKYTPDGGRIVFGAEIEDDYLKIFVRDNGYGIDSADLPFIFDKFYRGEKARNSDKGGSGLGLSICKYIVESHGGQIFVESSTGGSSFYFVIPKV